MAGVALVSVLSMAFIAVALTSARRTADLENPNKIRSQDRPTQELGRKNPDTRSYIPNVTLVERGALNTPSYAAFFSKFLTGLAGEGKLDELLWLKFFFYNSKGLRVDFLGVLVTSR